MLGVSEQGAFRYAGNVGTGFDGAELALLWIVNTGCIDMNPWTSRIDRPDRPDFALFDLDPTPEAPWAQTIEVALVLKELLDALGLVSFPKTSGGKGFHVIVSLDRRSTCADVRANASVVAGAIVRAHPELATTEWSKARRRGGADRREPERRGQDDRLRLLGAAARRRARADAACLGRGERHARSAGAHHARRPRTGSRARRPSTRAC